MTSPCLTIEILAINICITLRNKFNALQEFSETLTPNDEYKNFVNAYMEAAEECIPTKLRAKTRSSMENISNLVKKTRRENSIHM